MRYVLVGDVTEDAKYVSAEEFKAEFYLLVSKGRDFIRCFDVLYANTDSGESLVPVVTSHVTGERLIGGAEQGYNTYNDVMVFIGGLMDEYHAR